MIHEPGTIGGSGGMRRRTGDHGIRVAALALACGLALPAAVAPAQSPDRVRLTDKTEIIGEIIALSPGDVEIRDQRSDEVRKVAVDRIREVLLGGEPESVRNARSSLLRQQPAAALEELEKMEPAELDGATDNVLAEVAFVRAAATGGQATLTGIGLDAGEKALREFLQKHPRSHHAFRAQELLGDLLVRAGKYTDAAAAYAALEQGPQALRVRGAMAKAASFYEQKKYAEADREYAAAEKNCVEVEAKAVAAAQEAKQKREQAEKAKSLKDVAEWKKAEAKAAQEQDAAAAQKLDARVGRARCLTRQGKAADAVQALQGVLREADPEDREFLARAYATLGDACRSADKSQDAIIAFLAVDLVYNTLPEVHAEALYNLVELWLGAQNPERSREARQSLETTYPDSRWTKALAAAAGKG